MTNPPRQRLLRLAIVVAARSGAVVAHSDRQRRMKGMQDATLECSWYRAVQVVRSAASGSSATIGSPLAGGAKKRLGVLILEALRCWVNPR